METVLVCGGAGFIGSCLIRHLLQHTPWRVINLDVLSYAGSLERLTSIADDDRYLFVEGDIGDTRLVGELFEQERPRAVVNLAAETHVDRSIDGPAEFLKVNVLGTFSLLQVSRRYWESADSQTQRQFRFLQISTDEVYGSAADGSKFREDTPYAPNSPYAASKASADHFVRAFGHTYGLPTLITNCSNNYGPYQFPEKLIPLMILNAFEGRPLPVYGDGQQVRDWLFVDDHCDALCRVLQEGRAGEVYNIGGHCEQTNLAVVEQICDAVDQLRPGLPHAPCRSLITFVDDRPGHDRRYAVDCSKLEQELGWKPREDFRSGLARTVGWYHENAAWVGSVSGEYRRQRLGLGERNRQS